MRLGKSEFTGQAPSLGAQTLVNSARGKPGGTEADIEKAMFGAFTERVTL